MSNVTSQKPVKDKYCVSTWLTGSEFDLFTRMAKDRGKSNSAFLVSLVHEAIVDETGGFASEEENTSRVS